MDKKRKKEYLKKKGVRCPYCWGDDIAGGRLVVSDGQAYQEVSCLNCHNEWRDIYTLTGVEGKIEG